MIDRETWKKQKREAAEERMDRLFSPVYDQEWGSFISPSHRQLIRKFIDLCPVGAIVLDAACGTGKYWPLLLAAGFSLFGIDQSKGMLSQAKSKHPHVPVLQMGLQEMHFSENFDGIICVDAMENVFPEDWPLVLKNFHQVSKSQGILYLTVETADPEAIEKAYQTGLEMGFPVLPGEWAFEEGYHYYPKLDQVRAWIKTANFSTLEEADGDEYHHFLLLKG